MTQSTSPDANTVAGGKPNKPNARRLAYRKFLTVCGTLTEDSIAIDCGANVGEFTGIMAPTGCRVYAFEPDPYAYQILTTKFGNTANVTLINKAVSSTAGTAKLYFHHKRDKNIELMTQGSSLLSCKSNVDPNNSVDVEIIDLIGFIQALDRPVTLLKIDIEGEEAKVLEALLKSPVIDQVGAVFVETHERKVPEIAETMAWVRQTLRDRQIRHINLDWR